MFSFPATFPGRFGPVSLVREVFLGCPRHVIDLFSQWDSGIFLASGRRICSLFPFAVLQGICLERNHRHFDGKATDIQLGVLSIKGSRAFMESSSSTSWLDGRGRCLRRFPYKLKFRARAEVLRVPKAQTGKANAKTANLSARRRERLGLPHYDDERYRLYPISKFLSQPEGFKSILNTEALEDFKSLESNTYRCTLRKIQLLNFEVAPMLDVRVTSTSEDCTVEMLSCKFEGSKIVEQQNDRFSAFMKNHITWNTDGERFLDVDVKLNVSLEVYTRPFTLMPVSAIEKPGNLVMQSLVDKLVPLLLQQLVQDYENWVQEQRSGDGDTVSKCLS